MENEEKNTNKYDKILNNFKKKYDAMSSTEKINYLRENGLDVVVTNMVGMPEDSSQQTAKNDDEMER